MQTLVKKTIHSSKKEAISLSEKFNLLTRNLKRETKSVYASEINHFLRFVRQKSVPDEWDLRKFFAYLDRKGFSRSYQRNAWYAIKTYFRAKGLEWTLEKADYPKMEKSRVTKAILSRNQVVQMIEATKLLGNPSEAMFLALSSTYGLRCSEIIGLTESEVYREAHTLYIETKKGGESRYHLIPSQVRPYLYPWNFDTRISHTKAYTIFNAILQKSGIEKLSGMAWHSIRRSLFTELSSTDLPIMRIANFGRWKLREYGSLPEYDNPDFREVDELIFSKHPFIEIFEN